MRHFLLRLASQWCLDCGHVMWPWQPRCGQRHTTCKHAGDLAIWRRNDYPVVPWDCSYCGRPITEARP